MTLDKEIQRRLTSIIWEAMTQVIVKGKDAGYSRGDAERLVNQIMNDYEVIPRIRRDV
jgi:hypothetical protein